MRKKESVLNWRQFAFFCVCLHTNGSHDIFGQPWTPNSRLLNIYIQNWIIYARIYHSEYNNITSFFCEICYAKEIDNLRSASIKFDNQDKNLL